MGEKATLLQSVPDAVYPQIKGRLKRNRRQGAGRALGVGQVRCRENEEERGQEEEKTVSEGRGPESTSLQSKIPPSEVPSSSAQTPSGP